VLLRIGDAAVLKLEDDAAVRVQPPTVRSAVLWCIAITRPSSSVKHALQREVERPARFTRVGRELRDCRFAALVVAGEPTPPGRVPDGALVEDVRERRDIGPVEGLITAPDDCRVRLPTYRDLDTTVAGAEQRRENISEVWAWLGCHDVARQHVKSLFSNVHVAVVPALLEQTAEELNGLLRTTSGYQRLSLEQRQALEREHVAMYERLGRPIRSSTVAVLVTARRTAEF
jgi:hypothetical protein